MASSNTNVAVTAGSGSPIAVRSIDQGNGLVDVQYVASFTERFRISATPTISSSPAYTSGDVLGTLMSFTSAARVSGFGGIITGVQVLDKTQAQRAAMTLLLSGTSFTAAADNAAFAPSDADSALIQAQIEILSTHYNTAWAGTPLNSIATVPHNDAASSPNIMRIPYVCSATTLYGLLVVRGTPTYTSTSDIIVSLNVELD
jgi:hypothetical protein